MVTLELTKAVVRGIRTNLIKKTYERTGTVVYIRYIGKNPVEYFTPKELGL